MVAPDIETVRLFLAMRAVDFLLDLPWPRGFTPPTFLVGFMDISVTLLALHFEDDFSGGLKARQVFPIPV